MNKSDRFSLPQMKRSQKFAGCDYKDNTRNVLNKLFSCKMMSEINLKENGKKVGITDMEILKVIEFSITSFQLLNIELEPKKLETIF